MPSDSLLSLTPFGWIYLPIVLAVLAFKRAWLLPLLIVSAVLHAPAVAVLRIAAGAAPMGVTPWLITSAAVFVHLCELVLKQGGIQLGEDTTTRRLAMGWMVFFVLSITSAFTLPFLFAGVQVFPVETIDFGTQPLRWRPLNALHAINFAVLAMLCLYVLQLPRVRANSRNVLFGLVAACVVTVAFSVFQRLQVHGVIATVAQARDSLNPSYFQFEPNFSLSFVRTSWPFTEPSYASVWFAAVFSAGLATMLFGRHAWPGLTAAVCGALGVLSTAGGSGTASIVLSSLIIFSVAVICVVFGKPFARARTLSRLLLGLVALASATLSLGLLNTERDQLMQSAKDYYSEIIEPRLDDDLKQGHTRSASNREALRIIEQTYFMGAGLGSNRVSSFVLSMASGLGLLATVLFFCLVGMQVVVLLRAVPTSMESLAVSGGLVGTLLGCIVGIPDLGWPGLWIWILASLAVATCLPPPDCRTGPA